jgi:pimeloyl-ACP methyl ester carboxylesterase
MLLRSPTRFTPEVSRRRKWPAIVMGAGVAAGATALLIYSCARRAEKEHPATGKFLDVDGVRLHFIDRGDGPAVVLLHGNGSMARDFQSSGLIDVLARKYRVIAFDRPGYGYSTRPRDRFWTPEAQGRLLCAALQNLGVSKATFVGHSWGTLVSLAARLARPECVRGLVLISGYYFPGLRLDVALFAPPAIPVLGDVLRYTISPVLAAIIARPLIRKMFSPCEVPAEFDQGFPVPLTLRPWHIRASAEEAAAMVPAAASLRKRFGEIAHPLILIAGAGDRIVDVEKQSLRLRREIPHAELHILPGLGHMLHYFAQQPILNAIDAVTLA